MKLMCLNIYKLIKYIAFAIVFMSLLGQTVSVTISVLMQNETEFTLIDVEEDSDEEEKKEKTDEKIKPLVYYTSNSYFKYPSKTSYHIATQKLLDINQEIPIPPPDLIT